MSLIVWFCCRTGLAAMLLLAALGVPRNQILLDYMETERSAEALALVKDSAVSVRLFLIFSRGATSVHR
jgi:hypothetical protein